MKKIISTLMLSALGVIAGSAQALFGYGYSASSEGTFVALDSPTVIYTSAVEEGAEGNSDFGKMVFGPEGEIASSGTYQGYAIGFDFPFCGDVMNQFIIGGGNVQLGNGEVKVRQGAEGYIFSSASTDNANCIAAVGLRGTAAVCGTEVAYQVVGEAPNRELVVQYKNMGLVVSFWGAPTTGIDMQLRMGENGTVKVVFANTAAFGADGSNMKIGMRHNVSNIVTLGGDDYLTAQLGKGDGNQIAFNDQTPNGATLTFSYPEACQAPANAPADLQLNATSTKISGQFAAAEGAEYYLVTYGESPIANAVLPENGTAYAKGDKIGEETVAYYGDALSFDIEELASSTAFEVKVYAANANGLEGPKYNPAPATATVATMPGAPGDFDIEGSQDAEGNFVYTLSCEANAAGDNVLVLCTETVERDSYGDHGLFPELEKVAYEAGYVFENGAKVLYAGPAGEDIALEPLPASKAYYLAAYSYDSELNYSTDVVYDEGATPIEAPYSNDFANEPRFGMPIGWDGSESDNETGMQNVQLQAVSAGYGQPTHYEIVGNMGAGNAYKGSKIWMETPVINAAQGNKVRFSYRIEQSPTRFGKNAYNEWEEDDALTLSYVTTDNYGEDCTWNVLTTYDVDNHPTADDTDTYLTIEGELPVNGLVVMKLDWQFYSTAFNNKFYVNKLEVEGTAVGIQEMNTEKAAQNEQQNVYYDLSGRRINGQPKAGVYISNGKKSVVK